MTTWEVNGEAADPAGEWSGQLWKNDNSGTPTMVTGTFSSQYGEDGRMVGAFGANLDSDLSKDLSEDDF